MKLLNTAKKITTAAALVAALQAVTAQAGQIGQVVTVGGAVLPCADWVGGSPFRC